MANETKTFRLPQTVKLEDVVSSIETFLRMEKGMETQSAPTVDGYFLQASQPKDGWKTISGTRLAINIQFMNIGDFLNVTVGEGSWSDKVGASTIGMIVAFPFAVSAGVGIYKQKKLPAEIFDRIERAILSGGFQAVVVGSPTVDEGAIVCPHCKTQNPSDSRFCKKCGTSLVNVCPDCGAHLDADTTFCPHCGHRVVA